MTDVLDPEGIDELRALGAARSLLAFDFDGTLAPIARQAHRAAMRPRTRTLLAEVALRYPCAIVSGRRLSDLRPRFEGLPIRWFVGNHGAEGLAPFAGATHARRAVARWRESLASGLAGREGVWIEDKGYSLSVHYRGATSRAAARRAILERTAGLAGARIVSGKCVVNLVHASAPDKGAALAALVRRVRPERVLFAGDDDTDEDAFGRDLAVPATTIRVGGTGPSRARYRLVGQGAIDRLLAVLLSSRPAPTEEEE